MLALPGAASQQQCAHTYGVAFKVHVANDAWQLSALAGMTSLWYYEHTVTPHGISWLRLSGSLAPTQPVAPNCRCSRSCCQPLTSTKAASLTWGCSHRSQWTRSGSGPWAWWRQGVKRSSVGHSCAPPGWRHPQTHLQDSSSSSSLAVMCDQGNHPVILLDSMLLRMQAA